MAATAQERQVRTVLITGGSSGIGSSLVRAFAAANNHHRHQEGGNPGDIFRVWFTYRSGEQKARSLLQEINSYPLQSPPHSSTVGGNEEEGSRQSLLGHGAFYFDQGSWESHENFIGTLPGSVDILINNAALGSGTAKAYAPEEHLQDQALLQVNAVGVLWLTSALVPEMVRNGYGKVVFISSVGGGITQFPSFRLADGMSKAAVAFLSKQLAAEHTHSPVSVFCVCPGATDTEMFQASTLNGMTVEERHAFERRLPKRRLITPDEISKVVFWLCRPEAECLHGAVIDTSLGLGVHPGLMTGGS